MKFQDTDKKLYFDRKDSYQVGRPEGSARHKIDFFHVFHIQLFEDADGTGVFKTAFKGKLMNLFFIQIKTELPEAGGHFYGAEKIFHASMPASAVFSKST